MISKTYPLGSFERYKYVVIMSRMDGGFLLSRHKQRTTWEFQGGHIEPGETPMQAARRNAVNRNGHGRCGRIDRRAAQARGKGAHTGNRQRRAAERGHEARHGGAPFVFFVCGE